MVETFGFLAVRQHESHGFFGGLLVLNEHARPLEFHCTLPVAPSKAQRILYGQTLNDFLCGEQIAKALLCKAKLKPSLIVTDCSAVLAVQTVAKVRVVYMNSNRDSMATLAIPATSQSCVSLDVPHLNDKTELQVLDAHTSLHPSLAEEMTALNEKMDLAEPFQRITEALGEALPSVKAA